MPYARTASRSPVPRDERPYVRTGSARRSGVRFAFALTLGLLALTACGGGGGGVGSEEPKPEAPAPPGIAGQALMADLGLGRIAEQEPNDSRTQPCRLAPVGPRTLLEVTGEASTSTAER